LAFQVGDVFGELLLEFVDLVILDCQGEVDGVIGVDREEGA
jgi:hypothetical protein